MEVLSCVGNLNEVVELRMVFLSYFHLSTGCLSMFITHTETHLVLFYRVLEGVIFTRLYWEVRWIKIL